MSLNRTKDPLGTDKILKGFIKNSHTKHPPAKIEVIGGNDVKASEIFFSINMSQELLERVRYISHTRNISIEALTNDLLNYSMEKMPPLSLEKKDSLKTRLSKAFASSLKARAKEENVTMTFWVQRALKFAVEHKPEYKNIQP